MTPGTGTIQNYTYDTTYPDRLKNFNGKGIVYNTLHCPTNYDGKSWTWTKGKLTRVRRGSANQPGSEYKDCTFTYDGYGRRINKQYIYDPNPAVAGDGNYYYDINYSYDESGRLIREFCTTHYDDGTDSTREFIFLYDESGIIGTMYSLNGATAQPYYYRRNLQGDVIAIYDKYGSRKAEYAYDAFGNCTVKYTGMSDLANSNPIRYRGYYYDRETGLYYLNSRYYNPEWRRFISPAKTEALTANAVNGLNLYIYANNNPILYPYIEADKQIMSTLNRSATLGFTNNTSVPNSSTSVTNKSSINILSFSDGLITPEKYDMPACMSVHAIYAKGTLGWGYTFGDGYSLASFSAGILDATLHTPKWFAFLPDDHLANPNVYLGVGTWNVNASVGVGVSGTAEIVSGTVGIQFGNAISIGVKGYVGVGFTIDFTNGIRFGIGWGLGYEISLNIDWHELFY